MILWAMLATKQAKVYHAWDHKWDGQPVYMSLCGLFRPWDKLTGYEMTKQCKTCVRIDGYHLKRPPPVFLKVTLDMGPKDAGGVRFNPHQKEPA